MGGGSSNNKYKDKYNNERPKRTFEDFNIKKYSYVLLGIGVAFLAMLISQGVFENMERLDITDTEMMKMVFSSGNDSWVIQCIQDVEKEGLYIPFDETSKKLWKLSKKFMENQGSSLISSSSGSSNGGIPIRFGTLNCHEKLPGKSGKNVIERFKLNNAIKPLIFVTNPLIFKKPKQILPRYLKTSDKMVKEIQSILSVNIDVIDDKQFLQRCITGEDKDSCLLFLKGTKVNNGNNNNQLENVIQSLQKEYRKGSTVIPDGMGQMKLATIDSIRYELSIESRMFRFVPGENRILFFHQDGNQLKAKAYHGDMKDTEIIEFVKKSLGNDGRLKKLDEVPTITKRIESSNSNSNSKSSSSSSDIDMEQQQKDKERKAKARRRKMEEKMKEAIFEESENAEESNEDEEEEEDDDEDEEEEEEEVIDLD